MFKIIKQYESAFPKVNAVYEKVLRHLHKSNVTKSSQGLRVFKNHYLTLNECRLLRIYLEETLVLGNWSRAGLEIPKSAVLQRVLKDLNLL